MIGLLVNFNLRCGQIILGGTAASSLPEKWPEARRSEHSSCNVGHQYWCVWWRGLAAYLQTEPLESRASPLSNLLSKPCMDSGTGGVGGQNFPNFKILPWWEETGT